MKISMYSMSVETCLPLLATLSALLDKGLGHAAAKKYEPAVLVNARLAPDMLPLSRQVQIACDMAKNGCSRLAGQEPPRFEARGSGHQSSAARSHARDERPAISADLAATELLFSHRHHLRDSAPQRD